MQLSDLPGVLYRAGFARGTGRHADYIKVKGFLLNHYTDNFDTDTLIKTATDYVKV